MCGWSLRVLWTVCQNMFVRLWTDCLQMYCSRFCWFCCCCGGGGGGHNSDGSLANDPNDGNTLNMDKSANDVNFADYIMITDQDEIEMSPFALRPVPSLPKIKPVESESYYRAVDRFSAEEILCNRLDGSCLVRPYRETDEAIKYIVTVYAKHSYFHLYIRYVAEKNRYGVGLKKPFEKLFNTPNDVINYYRINKLFCTNRTLSACVFLIPIT